MEKVDAMASAEMQELSRKGINPHAEILKLVSQPISLKKRQIFPRPEEADKYAEEGYVWKGNMSDGRCVMELPD